MLDRVFGALPANGRAASRCRTCRCAAVGRRIVHRARRAAVGGRFGGAGIARKDPDFIPAFIVNHILGGGSFTSRLYNEVREKRGLAYAVYSYLLPLDHAAMFMARHADPAPTAPAKRWS